MNTDIKLFAASCSKSVVRFLHSQNLRCISFVLSLASAKSIECNQEADGGEDLADITEREGSK